MKFTKFIPFILCSVGMLSMLVACSLKSEKFHPQTAVPSELQADVPNETTAKPKALPQNQAKSENPDAKPEVLPPNQDNADTPDAPTTPIVHAPIPGWPQTDEAILASTEIPDFSKYALAIHRALGCEFSSSPEDAFKDDQLLDPHNNYGYCNQPKDPHLLQQLVAQKADINAYNKYGCTLLSLSLFHTGSDMEMLSETQFFELLLKNGADITKPDADGSTILMQTEFIETAKLYIAANGDVHIKDKRGITALDYQKGLLRLMIEGDTIDDDHFPYFYEEGSMGCNNEDEIEAATQAGKQPPECITYADIMKDNIRQIIALIEKS